MKFYGIDMEGIFLGEIVSTAPAWSASDEGRLIYAQDTTTYYYGSNSAWIELGGGGGASLPLVLPKNCSLDDTDNDISRGSAFSMVETINFGSTSDGACWFSFQFPSAFDDTTDLKLDIFYNLDGGDNSKIVTVQTKYWVYGDGDTPNPASPNGTNSNDIDTGTGEDGKRQSASLNPIPNSALTAGDTITLKVTRLSSDTYAGTFQMFYIYMYQTT